MHSALLASLFTSLTALLARGYFAALQNSQRIVGLRIEVLVAFIFIEARMRVRFSSDFTGCNVAGTMSSFLLHWDHEVLSQAALAALIPIGETVGFDGCALHGDAYPLS